MSRIQGKNSAQNTSKPERHLKNNNFGITVLKVVYSATLILHFSMRNSLQAHQTILRYKIFTAIGFPLGGSGR
jgi:hypothetical protein